MNKEDIDKLLNYGYWICVDIEHDKFIAKIYRLNKRSKKWKQIKFNSFDDSYEAWDWVKLKLMEILKFML